LEDHLKRHAILECDAGRQFVVFFYGMLTALTYLRQSRSNTSWILAGLVLTLIIIVATLFGRQILERIQDKIVQPQISGHAKANNCPKTQGGSIRRARLTSSTA
jgi:hypothetical protein